MPATPRYPQLGDQWETGPSGDFLKGLLGRFGGAAPASPQPLQHSKGGLGRAHACHPQDPYHVLLGHSAPWLSTPGAATPCVAFEILQSHVPEEPWDQSRGSYLPLAPR